MGSKAGAEKSAAKKCGCTVEEWRANRDAGLLWCFRCSGWKPKALFRADRSRASGYATSCKPCASHASAASRYRIAQEEIQELRNLHDGHCPICLGRYAELVIDHDHDDGHVRGLLCSACNVGLGLFGDDIDNLRSAIHYLENDRGRKHEN